jgi:hypothetical protein
LQIERAVLTGGGYWDIAKRFRFDFSAAANI